MTIAHCARFFRYQISSHCSCLSLFLPLSLFDQFHEWSIFDDFLRVAPKSVSRRFLLIFRGLSSSPTVSTPHSQCQETNIINRHADHSIMSIFMCDRVFWFCSARGHTIHPSGMRTRLLARSLAVCENCHPSILYAMTIWHVFYIVLFLPTLHSPHKSPIDRRVWVW